ncbi:MAG: HesA/MoeB/ThiF family protein [Paraprevotella sp.]|jgi:molybdopterin/thiamine biosynthesis adenylyltransferase|uniref:HesA/MoeB/ThiF family protein n=1 Tax=Paraprevotella sp. TaxID=2049036 RepID=UPI00257C04C1|nr:HesA/MoeB/ThiF family protein [Paraprevotella sp.]MBS4807680.1 HesA/MoeB/ThiF family protein [Paraprevotella sp.]
MLTMSGMEDKKLGRYECQTMLPEIRTGGQERLRAARVLVVGTGGLGSPVSLYLAGAGIGHIGLVDDDAVSTTNLHRQVLYAEAEVGLPKVVLAARRLRALNSDVDVKPYACRLTPDNAAGMIQDYDIVVDACDNYPTRYLLNDICRAQGKPYVYGAIEGFCGQVSVFCRTAEAKSYRDLYPDEEAAYRLPPAFKGVVGMTPAIVGSVQAHEVMKLVCGYGDVLDGRLWTIDLRTMQSYIIEL